MTKVHLLLLSDPYVVFKTQAAMIVTKWINNTESINNTKYDTLILHDFNHRRNNLLRRNST